MRFQYEDPSDFPEDYAGRLQHGINFKLWIGGGLMIAIAIFIVWMLSASV